MEQILDVYAQTNALRDVDTRLKLLIGVCAIIIGVASQSPAAPFFIAVSMAFITVALAKIPIRLYASLITIPVSFAIFSAIIILLMSGGGEPIFTFFFAGYPIGATTASANLALLVVMRTFGGMCSLYFIALTTPITEIFSVMHTLRFPRGLIDLSMLIYHFIFVLIGETISIHTAQVLRHGYDTFRNSVQSFAMLGAMVFIRAWQQGEDLVIAMDARCYDGKLELADESRKPGRVVIGATIVYLGACAYLAWLTATMNIF
ncbi:MAG: cobalt ECF transporter T component CbiQ [Methanoregula sp.]